MTVVAADGQHVHPVTVDEFRIATAETYAVIVEPAGKSDPERGVGAGLSTTDLGLRLRYEFRRELAPYIGVTWKNSWGKTADFARVAGEDTGGARFVTGMRLWF